MADNEIFTVDQMHTHARGTLEEWIVGYTDVGPDGRQRKIAITASDDTWTYVLVRRQQLHGGYDRKEKLYRIAIKVEEVEDAEPGGDARQPQRREL